MSVFTARKKIHTLVADALKALVRRAAQVAEYFARKRGTNPGEYRQKLDERFGKGEMRCPECGSTRMLLIRVWNKEAGLIYDLLRDGVRTPGEGGSEQAAGPFHEPMRQLAFSF